MSDREGKVNNHDILYQVSIDDVLRIAESMGIPKEGMNDDIIALVQGRIERAFERGEEVIKEALTEARIKFSLN